jgi:hypothetical protein
VEAVVSGARAPAAVLAALLAAALLAAGCTPEPRCGLRLCDIREPACQQDTARATACLRGDQDVTVPVKMITRAELQAQWQAEARAATAAEVEAFQLWQRALSQLQLGDAGLTLVDATTQQAAFVAAYYQPADKTVTVVDDGAPMDSRDAVTVLVHETAHALQDATVGFATFDERVGAVDVDRQLAASAVTEGEATLYEDLAALSLFGAGAEDARWDQVFGRWQALARRLADTSPMPVTMAWGYFPYPFGGDYVNTTYRRDGAGGVAALYDRPPASAAQVLAGHGAAEPGGGAWSEDLGAAAVPALPARWSYFDGDRLGGFLLDVFIERVAIRREPVNATSPVPRLGTALRADRFSVFKDTASGAAAACWRLRLTTPAAATALAAWLRPTFNAWSADRDVVVLTARAEDGRALDISQLSFGPVPAPPASPPPAPAPAFVSAGPRPRVPHLCPRRLR